ncbi:MAG: aminodeoxychorismate synthase component I, partial [Betaproteobacteria bacterium]
MNSVDGGFALFDSDDGGAILLSDYRRTISFDLQPTSPDTLEQAFAAIEAASAAGEWVALAVDYGLGACFEPAVAITDDPASSLRGWVFGACQRLVADGVAAFLELRLAEFSEQQSHAGIAEVRAALDAASYAAKVRQIKQWIAAGDCYQINLTFSLDFRVYGNPLALYSKLRQRQPVRYGAFISLPGETLLSCSPELFFERSGDRVVTRPMKGTAPRGNTPADDQAHRSALLASEKERAENIMIVDLLRNDLSRLAAPGAVRVEALCDAEAYPTLWQVASTVSADLPGVRLFDLFRALFPCGSITGAPKIRAMQCISELESRPRGLYTGALGWLAPGGDCRFNVAIRTLQLEPDGRAQLGIGSGIVIDAEPEREYAECLLKANFLTGFDPGFELIETLRLEDCEYPLLSYHLERLETSASALGFSCDI